MAIFRFDGDRLDKIRIDFTNEEMEHVKKTAVERGMSVNELISEAILSPLDRQDEWLDDRLSEIIECSENKDMKPIERYKHIKEISIRK